MKLSQWFAAEESALKNWAEKEINEITTYLSPFFKNIKPELEKDMILILKNALPVVLTALGDNPLGNLGPALKAAEDAILPALMKEGIALFQTTLNILYNGLVGYAQSIAPTTAQPTLLTGGAISVETPIPSGA